MDMQVRGCSPNTTQVVCYISKSSSIYRHTSALLYNPKYPKKHCLHISSLKKQMNKNSAALAGSVVLHQALELMVPWNSALSSINENLVTSSGICKKTTQTFERNTLNTYINDIHHIWINHSNFGEKKHLSMFVWSSVTIGNLISVVHSQWIQGVEYINILRWMS